MIANTMDQKNKNESFGIKNFLRKKWVYRAVTLILMAGVIITGISIFFNNNSDQDENADPIIKQVKTIKPGNKGLNNARLKAVGHVKASAKVDIVALSRGTVRDILFDIGDEVFVNKALVSLSNNLTLTNLINAETNYVNLQNSLLATKRITAETVRQSEIGVQSAVNSIVASETGVKTARDNLDNYLALQIKGNQDLKSSAIVSFGGHLNTIFNALDQIDSIIKADDSILSPGGIHVDPALGAKDPASLSLARGTYNIAKTNYNELNQAQLTDANITLHTRNLITLLNKTKQAVDAAITVLDNTVTNTVLTDAWLAIQVPGFVALRSTVVGAQTAAERTLQSLENLDLTNAQDQTSLQNAVVAAENQLVAANTNYNNSLATLESTRQSAKSQIIISQTSLDNARGQLSLARVQASDLRISTPIAGIITMKNVELGTEVKPGMKVAQVSRTSLLTIEVDMPVDDVYKIQLGQTALINPQTNNLSGTINRIYPSADPLSKKVRIEIIFDNNNNDLIAESSVDISIPLLDNYTAEEKIYIPLKAVTIGPTENFVFIVENDKAKKRIIEIGETQGEQIEVINGLQDSDELIVEGGKNLEDGEGIIVK